MPIYFGLELSTQFAIERAKTQARTLSAAVLARADLVSSQLQDLSQSLRALSGKLPCAAYAQSEMGKRVLQSPVLRAIAYADGTRIVCSSLGRTLDGLDLGPPDFVSLQEHARMAGRGAAGRAGIAVHRALLQRLRYS